MLVAGWVILVVAIAIFSSNVTRSVFIVAGLIVELLGLVLVGRIQRELTGERE